MKGHKGAAVEVPFHPVDQWDIPAMLLRHGRRGHVVEGTINGVEFSSHIVPRSKKFWLLLEADTMQEAGVEVGETAEFAISPVSNRV